MTKVNTKTSLQQNLVKALRCPCCAHSLREREMGLVCTVCDTIFPYQDRILDLSGTEVASMDAGLHNTEIATLRRFIDEQGWAEGFRSFLDVLPSERVPYYAYLAWEKQAAWKYLLELSGDKKVLILGDTLCTISISLCRSFQHVATIQRNKDVLHCLNKRAYEQGIENITSIHLTSLKALPFTHAVFDVVIIHNLQHLLSIHDPVPASFLQTLFREAIRVLKSDGILLLTGTNEGEIRSRLRRLNIWSRTYPYFKGRSFRFGQVMSLLTRVGFKHVQPWMLTPGLQPVFEIRSLSQDHSENTGKNLTWRRRLQETLLRTPCREWVIPAFAMVAYKSDSRPSFLEQLGRTIAAQQGSQEIQLRRYLLTNPDGVILICAAGDDRERSRVIIRLPMTAASLIRCRRNAQTIRTLVEKAGVLSGKVPRFIEEGQLYGQPYFVETAIPGITVDLPTYPIERIVGDASVLLTQFHKESAARCIIDESKFQAQFMPFFQEIAPHIQKDALKDFELVFTYLREQFLGRSLPLVFFHGDYKVENLILDPSSYEIRGVIDWDLSRDEGLPLLDLCYLLCYKEITLKRHDFTTVLLRKFIPLNLSVEERTIFEKYLMSLGIVQEQIFPLLILFWLHHIAIRMDNYPRWSGYWLNKNFYPVLSLVKRCIGQDSKLSCSQISNGF